MESNETKTVEKPTRRRIGEKFGLKDHATAVEWAKIMGEVIHTSGQTPDKVKIIRRSNETYDVIAFTKPMLNGEKMKEAFSASTEKMGEAAVEEAKKVHGLTAKERRSAAKKERK